MSVQFGYRMLRMGLWRRRPGFYLLEIQAALEFIMEQGVSLAQAKKLYHRAVQEVGDGPPWSAVLLGLELREGSEIPPQTTATIVSVRGEDVEPEQREELPAGTKVPPQATAVISAVEGVGRIDERGHKVWAADQRGSE